MQTLIDTVTTETDKLQDAQKWSNVAIKQTVILLPWLQKDTVTMDKVHFTMETERKD